MIDHYRHKNMDSRKEIETNSVMSNDQMNEKRKNVILENLPIDYKMQINDINKKEESDLKRVEDIRKETLSREIKTLKEEIREDLKKYN